jgi:hypothetical protein
VDIAGETLEEAHIKERDQLEEDEGDMEDSSDEREQQEDRGQLIEAGQETEGHFIEEEGQLAEAEEAVKGHLLEGDLDEEEEGHLDVVNPMNEEGGQLEEADESSQQIFLASHLALQMEVGEVRDGITNNKLERHLE